MRVLKTKGEVGADGRLRLDLPVELPAGPVREQRNLRDEW
jgi:hypothetical protein